MIEIFIIFSIQAIIVNDRKFFKFVTNSVVAVF